jgi:hypothetical protein
MALDKGSIQPEIALKSLIPDFAIARRRRA